MDQLFTHFDKSILIIFVIVYLHTTMDTSL